MQTSSPTDSLIVHTVLCDKVGVLRIFPSIAIECVSGTELFKKTTLLLC
jgi:hypothetical protein